MISQPIRNLSGKQPLVKIATQLVAALLLLAGSSVAGAQDVRWETPYYIDSSADISPIIEQDPNSDKVAVVYTKVDNMDRTLGSAQSYCDVLYFESTDGGVTWPSTPDTACHSSPRPGQTVTNWAWASPRFVCSKRIDMPGGDLCRNCGNRRKVCYLRYQKMV